MAAPVITGLVDVVFEQGEVTGGTALIDPDANAAVTDADGDYVGGSLTVSGLLPDDGVAYTGHPDIIELIGGIFYQSFLIGMIQGVVGDTLVITLEANADEAGVSALIQSLVLVNSTTPTVAARTLTITVTDAAAESAGVVVAVAVNGDADPNAIDGTADPNLISGGGDVDTLNGFGGTDELRGDAGDDILDGGADDDRLVGGAGADSMTGGDGDDIYIFDNLGDTAAELTGEGDDTIWSTVSVTLPDFVENIELKGGAAIDATGSSAVNFLFGNNGANTINGLDSFDYLTGGGGADTLNGGDGDDTLVGDQGADTLDGGVGADFMAGGSGNDQYIVDDIGDVLSENPGEGIDHVTTSATITALGDGVENVTIDSGGAVDVAGNALNNVIAGGAGANVISGLGGRDTISGFDGADSLNGGDGNDVLDGGAQDDSLDGGAGNDMLTGGAGDDTLSGGTGNDLYIVTDATQTIIELSGGGIDTVQSSGSHTLADEVEKLIVLSGDGTGNGLANTITGGGGANLLWGLGGVDILSGGDDSDALVGGDGNDRLTGGQGADQFLVLDTDIVLAGLRQVDTITDFNPGDGDQLDLSAVDADINTGADQAFVFVTGRFSGTAGEALISYQASTNTTSIRLDVDGDGKADYHVNLVGGDFSSAPPSAWIV